MNDDVPARLLRAGRPEDQDFSPDERLFRAVAAGRDISPEGKLLPSAVPFPDASFNREKYSKPRDVLIGRKDGEHLKRKPSRLLRKKFRVLLFRRLSVVELGTLDPSD